MNRAAKSIFSIAPSLICLTVLCTSCFSRMDIYELVSGWSPDAPFELVDAEASSSTSVRVFFSRPVDGESAQDPGHYTIPGLTVISAAIDPSESVCVDLLTAWQQNAEYSLTASGILDENGYELKSIKTVSFSGDAAPVLMSASSYGNTAVVVRFSEEVDQSSAENLTNYGIVPALAVVSAIRDAEDRSRVTLQTAPQSGSVTYALTVVGVTDLAGNPLAGPPANRVSFAGEGTSIALVQATSNSGVRIVFSNDVPLPDAELPGNYSIPGLMVLSALRDASDHSTVNLTTSAQDDLGYTLTVTGVIETDSAAFDGDVDPFILTVSSYSNTEVVVVFSEKVDHVSAAVKANYSIVGLSIVDAARDAVDHTRVRLKTGSQMDNTIYTLTVSGVTDLNGNPLAIPNFEDFYGTGITDRTPPTVLSAARMDADTVELQFSEPMDAGSAQTVSYYSIRDNLNTPVTVTAAFIQPDASRVRLDITGTFSAAIYTLSVSQSVTDLSFNPLAGPPNNMVSFEGVGLVPKTIGDGPVIVDPTGEGVNNYSMLTKFRGRIYIGPAAADNSVFRIKPDGSDPELVSFRFHVGSTYTSSLDPGPDDEDGIDYIAGATIQGAEYLFIGPSKSGGDLNYLYFTSDCGINLDFSPMDVGPETGGGIKGTTAMIVFNDRLYVGFPDTGGSRPYFHKIVNVTESPQKDVDFYNLEGKTMPRIGVSGSPSNKAGIIGIDCFGIFQKKLFCANGGNAKIDEDGGILRSTVDDPAPYPVNHLDWEDVTPVSEAEWNNGGTRFSMELPALNKLVPNDKAFPAMVEYNGMLYVIRNTQDFSNRPQLWAYDGIFWFLVGDDGTGICNMGNTDNSAASLLVVNGDRLYIGYDNGVQGAQLWRTKAGILAPSSIADFEPVSTDGFGDPSNNQRIYHGLSIANGGENYLWLLSGKSGGSVRVYRTKN